VIQFEININKYIHKLLRETVVSCVQVRMVGGCNRGEGGAKSKFQCCTQTVFAVGQYVLGCAVSTQGHTRAQKIKSQSVLRTVILPLLQCQATCVQREDRVLVAAPAGGRNAPTSSACNWPETVLYLRLCDLPAHREILE